MTVAIGIDGCRTGWFWFRFDGGVGRFGVATTIAEIIDPEPPDARALIDIPIGLRERGKSPRECDVLAREMLKPKRHSSVFPAPCRQAVREADYQSANDKNRRITGRALSRQSWGIAPKIREVDEYLLASEKARGILHEAHPEVVFCGLAGAPMSAGKKSREGVSERMTILQVYEPDAETWIASAFLAHGGFEATRDDVVDAFALALAARHPGRWRRLPGEVVMDPKGLPMNIVYMSR